MDPHTLCKKLLLHFFTKFIFCIYSTVLLFHGISIFSQVNSWIEFSVKMPDPDEAMSAVILLGNCRSIARLVSADREQEEMQKATYLRAAVASVLAYSLQNLDTCALCIVQCTCGSPVNVIPYQDVPKNEFLFEIHMLYKKT